MLDSQRPRQRTATPSVAQEGQGIPIRVKLSHLRALLLFGLGIAYLSNLFVKSDVLGDLALGLMIAVTVLCLAASTGSSRLISYLAFAVGIGLLLGYHAPWHVWTEGLEQNLYLVVMFSMVPLLRIPIRHGGYFEALQSVFRRFVHSRSRFYVFVGGVSAFLGCIVNLAIVPLVYEVSRASSYGRDKRLLSAAMTRGFTTATIWAPTTASIGLIMQLSGAQWVHFFPIGLASGVLAGLVGYGITMAENRRRPALDEAIESEPSPLGHNNYGKFAELCLFGAVLMTVIAVVSFVTGINTIAVVSMAALLFPIVWMGILRRLPILAREFRHSYFTRTLPNLNGEVALFAAAGILTTALSFSGLGRYIPQALSGVVGGNIFLLTTAMIAASVVLGAIGVHPIVMVAIFGGTVRAATLGVSPVYMAMVLAICWGIGISVSPSSATIIAAAGLARESPVRVGTRWNGIYAVVSAVTLIAFVTLLRLTGIV